MGKNDDYPIEEAKQLLKDIEESYPKFYENSPIEINIFKRRNGNSENDFWKQLGKDTTTFISDNFTYVGTTVNKIFNAGKRSYNKEQIECLKELPIFYETHIYNPEIQKAILRNQQANGQDETIMGIDIGKIDPAHQNISQENKKRYFHNEWFFSRIPSIQLNKKTILFLFIGFISILVAGIFYYRSVENNSDYFEAIKFRAGSKKRYANLSGANKKGKLKVHIDSAQSTDIVRLSIKLKNKNGKDIRDSYVKVRYKKKSNSSSMPIEVIIGSEKRRDIVEELFITGLPEKWGLASSYAYINLSYKSNTDTLSIIENLSSFSLRNDSISLRDYIPPIKSEETTNGQINGFIGLNILIKNNSTTNTREKRKGVFDPDPTGKNLGITYFKRERVIYDTLITNITNPGDHQIFQVALRLKNKGNTIISNTFSKLHFHEKGTDSITAIKGILHSEGLGIFEDTAILKNLPSSWKLDLLSFEIIKLDDCFSNRPDRYVSIHSPKTVKRIKNSGYEHGNLDGYERYFYNKDEKEYQYHTCSDLYIRSTFLLTNTELDENY